jgi:subtilisin family serine protease
LNGCRGRPGCLDYAASFGGTSHATALVGGAAALVLSVNPALRSAEIRDILCRTARRIDTANSDPIGRWVDRDGDGAEEFSQWYGYGRIDVARAVAAATAPLPAPKGRRRK